MTRRPVLPGAARPPLTAAVLIDRFHAIVAAQMEEERIATQLAGTSRSACRSAGRRRCARSSPSR